MGKANIHIAHFSVGEFSPAGLARVDFEGTRLAAETQKNILPHTVGKGLARPGTEYIVGAPNNARPRLLSFVRDTDDAAILILSHSELRVMVDDAVVTRASVTSTVTNGDFSSSTGWTLTASDGAAAAISGGKLTMDADARGSEASCERSVTTSSASTEHALEITVDRGPVLFQCGSTSGGQDYITQTTLDTGYHSLAFTPTGTYYVKFTTRNQRDCIVDSITVAPAGEMVLATPWATADLRDIAFDQSADIIFMANKNYSPRKIERRGTTSWSVVEYQSDDGPMVVQSEQTQKLTPAANFGNTTITADKDVFRSTHVGSLIRLYHERFDQTIDLAGDNQFTNVWLVRGLRNAAGFINDRAFTYTTTGTWVGTVTMQRSLTGEDGEFLDFPRVNGSSAVNFTSNLTGVTHQGYESDNNILSYTRMGFLDGDYTSGTISINVRYEGFSGYGVGRITAYNSATSVDVEVLDEFFATSGTRNWTIGSWSPAKEWPSAVAFYDGRLWWGGNDDFWSTASDAYYTMDDLEDGDGATIQRKVATGGQVSRINWFLPLARLVIGTSGAEAVVKSSSFDEPLTPQNLTVKDASTLGSAAVSPVKIDSRGIFVHRSLQSVHAIYYSFEANDFITDDLTELNEDICGNGIVEMAVQREPENYVWCLRTDGTAALLIYDWSADRQSKGWSRVVLGGTSAGIESVCVIPGEEQDRVYFSVKRTINGSTVRYIEKLSKHSEAECGEIHKMGDSGVFSEAAVSSITATHLANETGIVGWGTKDGVQYPLTGLSANSSGVISLGDTYSNVWVGLGYNCDYKSSKLAYAAQGGTALLQKKRVTNFGLLCSNTHRDAISFGPNFTTMRKLPTLKDGSSQDETTVYAVYDEPVQSFPGNFDTDSRICIRVAAPYGATINGIVFGIETNEK